MAITITVSDPLATRIQSRAETEKVPIEELVSRLLETALLRPLPPAEWRIANERRTALIEKRFTDSLTDKERDELQRLQDLADQQLEEMDAQMLQDVARMEAITQEARKVAE